MEKYSKITIVIIALGISLLLLMMVKGFFDALLLGAIFAGILNKVNLSFLSKTKKKGLAAGLTVLLFLLIVVIPAISIIIILVEQGIAISENIGPQIGEIMEHPESMLPVVSKIPFAADLLPGAGKVNEMISNIIAGIGDYVVHHLSDFSSGTANLFLEFFIFLYSLYYFLLNGEEYLKKLFYILPLKYSDEEKLFSNFTKVTAATLKGTLLIGLIQGGIGCIALAMLGVPNALFWGLIMIISSIIPAAGPALVWLPISIYLLATGQTGSAIFLIIFGVVVVGNIDNFLRPKLVGKGAGMPDLMILISTIGGLALFGISGLITGPIVGALFLSIWDIYAKSFKEVLYPIEDNISAAPAGEPLGDTDSN